MIQHVRAARRIPDRGRRLRLRSAASFFPDDRRSHSRLRQSVIDQNPALQERELHKLATRATVLADALGTRGVDALAATLAAQSGITVFAVAFTQWIREGEKRSFAEITADVLRELLTLTGQAAVARYETGGRTQIGDDHATSPSTWNTRA